MHSIIKHYVENNYMDSYTMHEVIADVSNLLSSGAILNATQRA